ncbi:MAG: TerC family protein [Candidatus Sericytochromatia bacterium]|nr:TerC family protein [Candidatus Sericytochromatia bacterium]
MDLALTLNGVTLDAVLKIIVIDLVLSGDNAVVIAMAVRRLPPRIARRAAIIGAAGAVILRILFAALAAFLLVVPYLQAVGGLMLFWIAYKLLIEDGDDQEIEEVQGFWQAVRVIVWADLVMSLDNILAVGGAAHGNLVLLVFGLALSIPIVLFGSQILTGLLHRWPALAYAGAGVLAWTAGEMLLHDAKVSPWVAGVPGLERVALVSTTCLVLLAGYLMKRKLKRTDGDALPSGDSAS